MVVSHTKSFCLNFTLKLLVFSSLGRAQNLPSTEEEGLGEAGKQICARVISLFLSFFFFKFNLLSFFDFCFTFWLPWFFGAVSRGSSQAAAHRLLIAVASLAVERDH